MNVSHISLFANAFQLNENKQGIIQILENSEHRPPLHTHYSFSRTNTSQMCAALPLLLLLLLSWQFFAAFTSHPLAHLVFILHSPFHHYLYVICVPVWRYLVYLGFLAAEYAENRQNGANL